MANLIQAKTLIATLATETALVVDCRYLLTDPQAGFKAYQESHIAGAHYLNLSSDLSGSGPANMGRHPLPSAARFGAILANIGFGTDRQVIAYDDAGGQFAARFWWLCKWAGFDQVALLDGGWQAWIAAQGPVSSDVLVNDMANVLVNVVAKALAGGGDVLHAAALELVERPDLLVSAADLKQHLSQSNCRLIDARAAIRYRGEQEPIDPVAGHIPGAVNHPVSNNLDSELRFLPADLLAEKFTALLAGSRPDQVIHSCGSGVTACHNLFAMELAGLVGSRLFAASWSGWIAEPGNLYVQGDSGDEGDLLRVDP